MVVVKCFSRYCSFSLMAKPLARELFLVAVKKIVFVFLCLFPCGKTVEPENFSSSCEEYICHIFALPANEL